MSSNNPWDRFRDNGLMPEITFEDTNGKLHVLQWQDIIDKKIDKSKKGLDCKFVLREVTADYKTGSRNVVITVTPETVRDIYAQAQLPLPKALEERLNWKPEPESEGAPTR